MPQGITCKVWNIKGAEKSKTTSSQISDSINYILNDEKTDTIVSFENSILNDVSGQLSRECQYVANDVKTLKRTLTGVVNLSSIESASEEMMEVKSFFSKFDGRSALHGVISLDELESDISKAPELMKLCEELLTTLFPNNQAVFAVHTNTENMHIHFIVNSVGMDGRKIHQPEKFISNTVHPVLNRLAVKYGFTPNDKWDKKFANRNITEYARIKIQMRKDIDLAIEKSTDFDEFMEQLGSMGLTVNVGKYMSLKYLDMKKPIRSYQLGTNYTIEAITERLSSKYNQLENGNITENIVMDDKNIDDVLTPKIYKLKKYSSLSEKEKKQVISLLRLGRNPWRENTKANWQLNNIANELNQENRIREYMHYYSNAGTVQECLDNILETKKLIAKEKKELTNIKRKYKPILDIYKQMVEIEKKAYLYEHENAPEYKLDFEKYRELTKRLKDGYHKDIYEVADFLNEYNERTLYATAMLNELSSQYREVRRYGLKYGVIIKDNHSLTDIVEFYSDKKDGYTGIFDAESFFIVSDDSEQILRITKTPTYDARGRIVESYDIDVLTRSGNIIHSYEGIYGNEARKVLSLLEEKCDFNKNCKKVQKFSMAKELIKQNTKETSSEKELRAKLAQSENSIGNSLTYTEAINLKSAKEQEGYHVIRNAEPNGYLMEVMTSAAEIRLNIVNNSNEMLDSVVIPGVKSSTSEGFDRLMKLKDKYNFTDEMTAFDTIENAYQKDMHEQGKEMRQ